MSSEKTSLFRDPYYHIGIYFSFVAQIVISLYMQYMWISIPTVDGSEILPVGK